MTVLGELAASVIEGFVADGFRRGYQEVKTAVRRRQAIDRALSGQELKNDDRVKKAIRDFEVVIGTSRGELTEAVAAFIREVERSAIPESITRCILNDGDPSTIYPAFEVIYRSFIDTIDFDSQQFFYALYTAIKLRTEQYVKDPALLEFVQAQNKKLSQQLEQLARSLSATSKLTAPLLATEIHDARLRLARSLESENRLVTVETIQGAKRCRIKHLVVPPRLATLATPSRHGTKKAKPKADTIISYLQFRLTVSRAVILGDPGGGKSTLTQLLCFDNSNSILLEASFPGKPEIDAAEMRVPLRIILRSFDKRRQATPGYNLFTYLIDQTKGIFDNDLEYTTRVLLHFLSLGNAIWPAPGFVDSRLS